MRPGILRRAEPGHLRRPAFLLGGVNKQTKRNRGNKTTGAFRGFVLIPRPARGTISSTSLPQQDLSQAGARRHPAPGAPGTHKHRAPEGAQQAAQHNKTTWTTADVPDCYMFWPRAGCRALISWDARFYATALLVLSLAVAVLLLLLRLVAVVPVARNGALCNPFTQGVSE